MKLCCFIIFSALLAAQPTRDIFQRLTEAPLPPGQGAAAASALRGRDFATVERLLRSARPATSIDRAELLSLQGAVDFLAERMDAASSAFIAAEKLAPLSDSDNFTLAMAQIKLDQTPYAIVRLTSLAAKHPQQSLYLYWLGKIDYDQRRYDEAIAKLHRVTELDPKSVRAYNSLGLAFDMQGKFEPARQALAKAADLNRSQAHPSAWPPHDLGYLLFRMDLLKEGEESLREALRYDPRFAQAHYRLGRLLERQNSDNDAIAEYEIAISLDKSSPEPCYSLAVLYRKLRRNSDANKMFAEYRKRKQGA